MLTAVCAFVLVFGCALSVSVIGYRLSVVRLRALISVELLEQQ
jgi:hypothetical protein